MFLFIEESNTLIVGGSDGRLNLFDVISKKEIRCFTQHRNAIFSIEKNLDRNHIYVGDQEGYLSIWDNKTWELQMMVHLNYLLMANQEMAALHGTKLVIR